MRGERDSFRSGRGRLARDPFTRLLAELQALGGHAATLLRHCERPWASITFSGTHHALKLAFDGAAAVEAGEQLIAELGEHEFTIPGQLVAEAAVKAVDHALLPQPRLTVDLELLLLEES